MRITYRWMKEYLTFAISPQEMIDRLTAIGHEVEEIIDLGLLNNPIRIARILSVEPHPDAGNLTVCQVDDGTDEPATVVCGAPNAAEGVVSVLARAGARLPSGQVLKRAKLRGVASEAQHYRAIARFARLQVTVVVPVHAPWEGVAETRLGLAGGDRSR